MAKRHHTRAAAMRPADESGLTLIEILVGLVIMSIVSTMLLMGWFALSRSYTYSVNANVARDSARQQVARMERELRDIQAPTTVTQAGIVYATPYWVQFYTSFNELGNANVSAAGTYSLAPHLVVYRLYSNKMLYRFEDRNGDGVISGINLAPATNNPTSFNLSEQTSGEGAMRMLTNVINYSGVSPTVPLFQYSYYSATGTINTVSVLTDMGDRDGIVGVKIHLLADLNPRRAPVYADLNTTAQLRNQR
jgi:prepilin-type N-terminal cleavage/methylation domain-containing protein